MKLAHLDFETRSRVDLKRRGAYIYAQDPSTEVLCLCYEIDGGAIRSWVPGQPFPADLRAWVDGGGLLAAHNAAFDRLIWWYVAENDHDFPSAPLEQWYCTAAQARARGLPGRLEDLGRCLGLRTQKDKRGAELIKRMSVPPFEWSEDLLAEMVAYCRTDVEVERAAAGRSLPLTEAELATYWVSERINDRGLLVDVEFARAATRYAHAETTAIGKRLAELTNGDVTTPRQFARLKDWVRERLSERGRKALWRAKTDRQTKLTEWKETLDKHTRETLLGMLEEDPDVATDPRVQEVLELTSEAGRTSVGKYQAMVDRADPEDERVRGAYIYAGAGQTGRWSSTGLQVHNFVRDTAKNPDAIADKALAGEPLDDVMGALASMLRPSIVPAEGHIFVCGDWSGIENRVLPWLSRGHPTTASWELQADLECQERLERLADPDNDEYVRTAETFGGERQEGKVAELSLGYGGGVGAFQAMARNYGVKVDDARAEQIKTAWRRANPWAPLFWQRLEGAAVGAMLHPGEWLQAGRVWYGRAPGGPLYCRLPSGRLLAYPEPSIDEQDKWGNPRLTAIKGSWRPKVGDPWPRFNLWSGLQAENVTQAVSADILAECMQRVDARLPGRIVGHTHDELLLEVPIGGKEAARTALEQEMLRRPSWAGDLPLAVKIWTGYWYRK